MLGRDTGLRVVGATVAIAMVLAALSGPAATVTAVQAADKPHATAVTAGGTVVTSSAFTIGADGDSEGDDSGQIRNQPGDSEDEQDDDAGEDGTRNDSEGRETDERPKPNGECPNIDLDGVTYRGELVHVDDTPVDTNDDGWICRYTVDDERLKELWRDNQVDEDNGGDEGGDVNEREQTEVDGEDDLSGGEQAEGNSENDGDEGETDERQKPKNGCPNKTFDLGNGEYEGELVHVDDAPDQQFWFGLDKYELIDHNDDGWICRYTLDDNEKLPGEMLGAGLWKDNQDEEDDGGQDAGEDRQSGDEQASGGDD